MCVCVSVCACVCMHVESIVAESDPRGPASYSLSAGDHNFHKTSIVGAELQTPETHTGNNSYMHAHTHTYAYENTYAPETQLY